jgi:heterodisulfide reductase subunit B2
MKYALFLGCNIPARVQQYERSARAVLAALQVELVDIRAFGCCGYPMRNSDFQTYLLFSAKSLALAEREGLDVLTLCQCCFGSLKMAAHLLATNETLKDGVNEFLDKKNLHYEGTGQVTHLLSVLHNDVGEAVVKKSIKTPFKDLKIAAHYGCHALRPSNVMQSDDPVAPKMLDSLVSLTGAKSVDWPQKLECCGAPLMGVNDDLSMRLAAKKLVDAKASGADFLSVSCPWCQIRFDDAQREGDGVAKVGLPSILYIQLLGLAMGIPGDKLGISRNDKDIRKFNTFIDNR